MESKAEQPNPSDHAALTHSDGPPRKPAWLNARRNARGEAQLAMGIGVHTGPVIAGAIGSPELLQYSYVGDTVNTASRIERLTRVLGRTLLVSGTTFTHSGGEAAFEGELMPDETLRGKREAQSIWAVSAARI